MQQLSEQHQHIPHFCSDLPQPLVQRQVSRHAVFFNVGLLHAVLLSRRGLMVVVSIILNYLISCK